VFAFVWKHLGGSRRRRSLAVVAEHLFIGTKNIFSLGSHFRKTATHVIAKRQRVLLLTSLD